MEVFAYLHKRMTVCTTDIESENGQACVLQICNNNNNSNNIIIIIIIILLLLLGYLTTLLYIRDSAVGTATGYRLDG
jgi:hypothetical protein